MYALAQGQDDGDDEWRTTLDKWIHDKSFRDRKAAKEKDEQANLPPWMKGSGMMLGTKKTIRLGMDDLTGLPLFMDTSRLFPGGDMLDIHSNTGGVPWFSPLTPSNPILSTLGAMLWNKDPYFGKSIVDENDTNSEAALKRGQWMWSQIAPAISINNYTMNRTMQAIAQGTGKTISWWPEDYTGIGRDGLPVQPKYAAMQNVGIKVRPIDLDASAKMAEGQKRKMIHDLEGEIRGLRRLSNKGALSEEQASSRIEKQREKIGRLRDGLTVDGEEKE